MEVRFVASDLRRLDGLKMEALSVPMFEDERQLHKAPGLVDWRVCGLVSRLLLGGRLRGARKEMVLVAARPRLTFEKLFLFDMGKRETFDKTLFREAVERMLGTLTRARVRASVLVLPGRTADRIAPVRAMEMFLEIAQRHTEHDEVTLVEDLEAQKAMAPVVERERRRARAIVGT